MGKEHQFRVMARRCNQCLFSDNKIVTEKRKMEILDTCRQEDTHFICHKATVAQMNGQLTVEEAQVCCRGFYDYEPMATPAMRLAHILDIVVFVDLENKK